MAVWPEDYVEKVLNDIEKYNGIRKTKKAGFIERCMQKFCNPNMLHPNPNDEFSQPSVGPNFGIVGQYTELARYNQLHEITVFEEPLIVQKMDPDGYLLLNGHHRWFAAVRMGIKKVHIQIVNVIGADDVNRMMEQTDNCKIVSFDFDEVLLSSHEADQEPIRDSLFSRRFKERLRKGAPELIKTLQSMGYDVWIYSGGYMEEDSVNDFFSMYEITVNGMLNGINEKKGNHTTNTKDIKEMMDQKYHVSCHIDNESVLYVDRNTKEYQNYSIPDFDTAWANGVTAILEKLR